MSTSALDIITGAAKLLGVVYKSEVLSADEANDGLVLINDMLDSWSNDGLIVYADTLETFPLTGAASYTIGTGGNFNTTRPISLLDAVLRVAAVDYPLDIITQGEYQTEIPVKSTNSQIPQFLTYDNSYPLAVIKLYPMDTSGSTLYLRSNKPLANLAALTTTVDLPPGWKKALKYNLALDMGPQYGEEPTASVVSNARSSLGMIKRATSINSAMPYMPSFGRPYSIYSGTE